MTVPLNRYGRLGTITVLAIANAVRGHRIKQRDLLHQGERALVAKPLQQEERSPVEIIDVQKAVAGLLLTPRPPMSAFRSAIIRSSSYRFQRSPLFLQRISGRSGQVALQEADRMDQGTVLTRLGRVPVFGLVGRNGKFREAADGMQSYFIDPDEARASCEMLAAAGENYDVKGTFLNKVFADPKVRLKAGTVNLEEANSLPADRRMCDDIAMPLFAIDGFRLTEPDSKVSTLPFFFSLGELLYCAQEAMDEQTAIKSVLVTDLGAVVNNMINGPAGPLKDVEFFPIGQAEEWMEKMQITDYRQQTVKKYVQNFDADLVGAENFDYITLTNEAPDDVPDPDQSIKYDPNDIFPDAD